MNRLPVYLRALLETGAGTVSSEELASKAGVNAAQLRKDLSLLGSYGTRGVGYDVGYLTLQIRRELGLTVDRRVAIVGVGNLGSALAGYRGFADRGFPVVAAFDANPCKVRTTVSSVEVYPMAELKETVGALRVAVAILTTPAHAAQGAANAVVDAGVTSILNFAPVKLDLPEGVSLRQVDLGVELQVLSFYARSAAARRSQDWEEELTEIAEVSTQRSP